MDAGTSTIRYQVKMTALTLKTEDDITNTWYFWVGTVPPDAAALVSIETALTNFYKAVGPLCVGDFSTGLPFKVFNMADPKPRVPIKTGTLQGITWGSNLSSIPREVAMAVSYQALYQPGLENRSRRGRLYMPPPVNQSLGNDGMLLSTTITTLKNAAAALLAASDADPTWTWIVFSEKRQDSAPIIKGFVDNAPDIQRRRGHDPSTRSSFP